MLIHVFLAIAIVRGIHSGPEQYLQQLIRLCRAERNHPKSEKDTHPLEYIAVGEAEYEPLTLVRQLSQTCGDELGGKGALRPLLARVKDAKCEALLCEVARHAFALRVEFACLTFL